MIDLRYNPGLRATVNDSASVDSFKPVEQTPAVIEPDNQQQDFTKQLEDRLVVVSAALKDQELRRDKLAQAMQTVYQEREKAIEETRLIQALLKFNKSNVFNK